MLRNAHAAASAVAKRVVSDLSQYPSPGDKLHGFTLLRAKHVPELELTALRLRHDKTGADYLHIARDDSNNVFSIGFRTNPADDTGVPHILEHTTLCGSRQYPIRDPFFKMMPRTLSNFMNALTASDHTFYPFATTNPQDFRNLMSVYLDATLHPLLNRSDFAQEGWRIGPENPQAVVAAAAAAEATAKTGGEGSSSTTTTTTPPSSLLFKGVVYNEMKGMMSDAGYLFSVRFLDHIFPDIHNSGGDPAKITDLTYEQLARFHREHYHPSNAKLFTYGDMPLEDHLREVDARLGPFEAAPADTTVPLPLDLSSGPREITEPGPVDPLVSANQQFKTSVSWITGDTTDVVESFSLALLSALLQDGYGSPLYRGLIEDGLGSDWSPNAGYDSSARRGIFTVGLTGVEEANVPKVKHRIRQLLAEARQKGFERQKIDGALHQLEISLKHKTAKFGLSLLYTLTGRWFTGVDPFDSLAWNDTIAAFEAELAKGGYMERLMDKYLLNDNTLTFTMAPSATFEADVAKEEQERLARKITEAAAAVEAAGKHGTTQVQKFLEEQEIGLLAEQGKTNTEDLSCLPTVYVKDIARSVDPLVVRDDDSVGVDIQWREAPTNGLTYFRALTVLENLPDRLRELIPLFADAIMRLGTKTTTVEQLEDLIKLKTGGVSVAYHCSPSPTDFYQAEEGIMIRGMALDRNVPAMLHLIRTLIVETDFDSPEAPLRIRQLLQASADGLVNDIASSGHGFARGYAEAGLTRAAWLRQQASGLSQVRLITSLAARPETDRLEDVIANLKEIQLLALAGTKMRAAVTCGASVVADNSASIGSFLAERPKALSRSIPLSDAVSRPPLSNLKTFFPLPYQVCYGALSVPTVSYTSPDAAPLSLLATALTHKYLHHEIREKGGAYGGGAYSSPVGGLFGLYSYRDPNPVNTLSIMRTAGRWAAEREWPDRDVDQAKIAVFQGVDAPKAVNERGLSRFLCGITEEMKQRRREQLLDATADQIREVARKYLVRDDGLSPADASCRVTFLGKRPQDWVNDETWAVQELDVKGVE